MQLRRFMIFNNLSSARAGRDQVRQTNLQMRGMTALNYLFMSIVGFSFSFQSR
jgi:hypothetical protein